MSEYFLLFKTAQAEFRCWREFNHQYKWNITPIVEFTRGRKKPRAGKDLTEDQLATTIGIYDFEKNIEDVVAAFDQSEIKILDLTREESLICAEISHLASSAHGYSAWTDFCIGLQGRGLSGLVPTLLVNPGLEEDEVAYTSNLRAQYEAVVLNFDAVAYRASVLNDLDFVYDLELMEDLISRDLANGKRFILVLDHEFINTGTGLLHALRTSNLIRGLQTRYPRMEVVVLGTSFPSTVTELGGEDGGSFPTEESYLYEEVMRQINDNALIYYGDYGSINPIRNDRVVVRGGWRPRIDFTTGNRSIYYAREKRVGASYASHYQSVAGKVRGNPSFEMIPGSWGVQQIVRAANGDVPASSPSFWISVRMEIFLQRQIGRLAS